VRACVCARARAHSHVCDTARAYKHERRALRIEEWVQQGEPMKKQQETLQAKNNVADSYVPGVLSTLKRGKIK
jgi:hypothetical protein